MGNELEDLQWLAEGEGTNWLGRIAAADEPLHVLARRLRRELSAGRVHQLLEQRQLRERARSRFPAADRMFFTRKGLEQATDFRIAAYKAERFPSRGLIGDLCCGIGGDLVQLAARWPAEGVERDPIAAYLAHVNTRQLLHQAAPVRTADVREIELDRYAAVHVDPDRRPQQRRSTQLGYHDPPAGWLASLADGSKPVAIKLAPAAVIDEGWLSAADLEWIGHHGECQQLVAWCGDLGRHAGRRTATVLNADGMASSLVGSPDEALPLTQQVDSYLMEPQSAVLAARLAGSLCERLQLQALTPRGGYLTGPRAVSSPWTTTFEVLEVIPFRLKPLRALLQSHRVGTLEMKQRGLKLDLPTLQRQLPPAGDTQAALLLLPRGRSPLAVLARRLAR